MATATKAAGRTIGHVTQVIGSTFDVEFAEDSIPAIYNAVRIDSEKKGVSLHLVGEVQQHLGGGKVRCVALGSTDGLIRGCGRDRHRGTALRAGRPGHARTSFQPAR
jgi:F-type H+/Na+-transporting ATPase subunit beta